ncbi:MAG: NTP transferase domain-containing protein [Bacteroidota bacterium]
MENEILNERSTEINGLVLSGGFSKRMGFDKGKIDYHGESQNRHLYNLLKPLCREVFISRRSDQLSPNTDDLPSIADAYLDQSPLVGILSALAHNSKRAWLIVACDMPFVNEKVLKLLIRARDNDHCATCFSDTDGDKPEPMLAIWEPNCLENLLDYWSKGNRSPRDFLTAYGAKVIPPPSPEVLFNANTKSEYNMAKTMIEDAYKPINCSFYDYLESDATLKKVSKIVYMTGAGKTNVVEGVIQNLFIRDKAEFLILDSGLEIRLDKMVSFNDRNLPDSSCEI